MALQTSGAISASDINNELDRGGSTEFILGASYARDLADIPNGSISFSDFYGASNVMFVITTEVVHTQSLYNDDTYYGRNYYDGQKKANDSDWYLTALNVITSLPLSERKIGISLKSPTEADLGDFITSYLQLGSVYIPKSKLIYNGFQTFNNSMSYQVEDSGLVAAFVALGNTTIDIKAG